MATFVLLLSLTYAVLAVIAVVFARRAAAASPSSVPDAVVVVAARNEEGTLPDCLEALLGQRYTGGRLRVIVADDQSDDETPAIVRRYAPGVEYLRVPGDGELRGKSAAIHAAVSATSEDIILLTDADCRPPEDWAMHMAAQFQRPDTGVVSGVTTVDPGSDSLLAHVQALDWTLLLTFAAGLSGLGVPLTAMGNNMAFRRKAYEDVGGYPALAESVTEDYALFQAIRGASWKAMLLLDRRLKNVTLPLSSMRQVFEQRKRWARGGLRTNFGVYLVYALVWLTHVAVLMGCVMAPVAGLGALGVKAAADALLLKVGTAELQQRGLWPAFPAFELYIFGYLIALPITLLMQPRITWRGRRY